MNKILSINTIKNVFAALGAKTSDDNYGVALLDKTTAEPKGLMGISDLLSLLDVIPHLLDIGNGTIIPGVEVHIGNRGMRIGIVEWSPSATIKQNSVYVQVRDNSGTWVNPVCIYQVP